MHLLRFGSGSNGLRVSVTNDGDGIPIEEHPTEKVWVPELIFGHLLTSSNYDDSKERTTGGRNGYGAKLTNVFSTVGPRLDTESLQLTICRHSHVFYAIGDHG